jgi:hypothetical protein
VCAAAKHRHTAAGVELEGEGVLAVAGPPSLAVYSAQLAGCCLDTLELNNPGDKKDGYGCGSAGNRV